MPILEKASKKRPKPSDDQDGSDDDQNEHIDKRLKEEIMNNIDDDDDDDEEEGTDKNGNADKKYDILHDEDIEGQEEGAAKISEGVRITPFNVQEEMEEGHFDADGNYVHEKKTEIRDAWLEELDDFTDEDYEKMMKKKADDDLRREQETDAPLLATSDLDILKIVHSILKPGETVIRALKRLGSGMKPLPKFKKGAEKSVAVKDAVREEFDKLTSATDTLLQRGHLEIYQDSFEKIGLAVKKELSKKSLDVGEEEDIFGETFVAKEISAPVLENDAASTSEDSREREDQTSWEFKWKNEDGEQIHGPYSSEQMHSWVGQDFFKSGVFVRKSGAVVGQFYTSKRVDFELYM